MAKLGSYYGLCPLIDHKSLLGVSEDVTPGCVIVTLGKNMAIKYKLSDQKQIDSWSTTDKLSSPVIYDRKEGRYVAVFNQNFIRFWKEDEKNLEKLKKIKFPLALHTIVPTEDDPIVIFRNGKVLKLSYALQIRKDLPREDIFDKSTVEHQTCLKIDDKYYIGLLIKSKDSYHFLWTVPGDNVMKIELNRTGVELNGHVVMLTENGPVLFTLWSDGRLYSQPLYKEDPATFYSIIESLSRKQPVCLLALSATYLAMYGADTNEEGASLQIYNIQFKVTQSKLALKLFSLGSKLWLIGNSMLLTIGQNLAVVPFHLDTEQLAALVGSHKLTNVADDQDVSIVTEFVEKKWEVCPKNEMKLPNQVEILNLLKEGWSETAICEEIFPKLIEKKDTRSILANLEYFVDIPESVIVKLLSYTIGQAKISDVVNKGITGQYGLLLNKILTVSYSDVLLLPQLRFLKFDEVLILLQYFCFLLGENGCNLPNLDTAQSERKTIEWGCIILDAHYQQFLLTKDSKVIECLQYFMVLIDSYLLCMDGLKNIEPVLSQIQRGKNITKLLNTDSLKYSIENFVFSVE